MVEESGLDAQLVYAAGMPDFRGWLARVERIGGCASPVKLAGHSVTRDAATGEVLHVFSSADLPGGRLMIACGNRRASRCEACAYVHAVDTYVLVVTGLAGGKGVAESVAEHPRVFVTLTAPSFGAVHRVTTGVPCRPAQVSKSCEHGVSRGCGGQHGKADLLVGTPLCPRCYDYTHAVLWNAHASGLWDDFVKRLRFRLASVSGVKRSELREHVRVSYAKVAEFQRRGAVHLHVVIRLDGPDGPGSEPPGWADGVLLADAVRHAAGAALLSTTRPDGAGLALRFGSQVDIAPIRAFAAGEELSASGVARYVAKYVTKGDIPGLVLDRAVRSRGHIEAAGLTGHGRALALMCWDLAEWEQYGPLRLRAWAHQLGWRGNVATKSRVYSTTYTALNRARIEHRRSQDDRVPDGEREMVTEGSWVLDGVGHDSPGEVMFAAGIAEDKRLNREIAREAGAYASRPEK
ncbi:replication initiation protein [Catenulispora sp. NL8]|uniref:Replication initiation protein n=1 Tax=Catenulispora pinistramenti TaxID=2705254 RepID=A0ABS5L7J2_9ACTN|nr:replication initiator [Catenulispora pinistramenti]MBS2554333.1 replication initiation protein [Catenulispora pinistramenti]